MSKKYIPKYLKPWTRLDNYVGTEYTNYYHTGFSQSRDSNLMELSNFTAALDTLGGESKRAIIVNSASHWAVGWIDSILIHKSAYAKLRIGDELRRKVDQDYPLLDEDSFSELERDKQEETLKCYAAEFMKELVSAIGRPLNTQDEIAEAVDLISDAYFEDCGYCGTEDAWISAKSLKRFLMTYEGQKLSLPIATELRVKLDTYPPLTNDDMRDNKANTFHSKRGN